MTNANLHSAKEKKNDEFYTQYDDIQKEMNAYLEYDPDVFRDKTILCPCDDPEWSNFTKYFTTHFEEFGIKKLISTSYAPNSKREKYGIEQQITIWEVNSPNFDEEKTQAHGKVFILDRDNTRDLNGDGRIDIDDIDFEYLDGDGDFRSEEVCKLRDEADIIITNPPFSLFREFIAWIGDKKFCIIGNKNSINYKEFFPLIKDNKVWIGNNSPSNFNTPSGMSKQVQGLCRWFTNLEHGRKHELLDTMPMERQIRYSKHKEVKGKEYLHYDNYDAIDVPYVDAIPSDYTGVMGVPITFLDKYCPEQFEIIGLSLLDCKPIKECIPSTDTYEKGGRTCYLTVNKTHHKRLYGRVFIRFTTEWIKAHPNDFNK